MKHILVLAAPLLAPLAVIHAAEQRDTTPDTWVAADALVQLKTCGMWLSGRHGWEAAEQNIAMPIVGLR